MSDTGPADKEVLVSDTGLPCDLCQKRKADYACRVKLGAVHGGGSRVVCVCWKCPEGIPDHLLDALCRSVLIDRQSVSLARMFVTQQAPRVNTNDTFMRGWTDAGGKQFERLPPREREAYMQPARDAGVSTNGKVYVHEAAAYPGDPEAWCSTKEDIKALVAKRGWKCAELGEGGRDAEPAAFVPLAEDLVREKVVKRLEGLPQGEITKRLVADTREQVIETHGAKPQVRQVAKKKPRFRDYFDAAK